MLRHRTVNLTVLATENQDGAKSESRYRRFQNFFLLAELPLEQIGAFILGKLAKPPGGWVLSMDRTNWKYGGRHINILTIGVVIGKVAVPIVWKLLPQKTKRGNSNTTQRINITRKLLRLMDATDIRALTMDREFGGSKWLKWLDDSDIGYVVRIKSNTLVSGRHASKCRKQKAARRHEVWGLKVYFSHKRIVSKGRRDDQLYIISNRFQGKSAQELYKMRWSIEQLFSHLKKRGFNIEDTHMSKGAKLEKLFALVSLAFLFSYGWGCQLRSENKLTKATSRKSTFRLGLENILSILSIWQPQEDNSKAFDTFIRWLNLPKFTSIFIV